MLSHSALHLPSFHILSHSSLSTPSTHCHIPLYTSLTHSYIPLYTYLPYRVAFHIPLCTFHTLTFPFAHIPHTVTFPFTHIFDSLTHFLLHTSSTHSYIPLCKDIPHATTQLSSTGTDPPSTVPIAMLKLEILFFFYSCTIRQMNTFPPLLATVNVACMWNSHWPRPASQISPWHKWCCKLLSSASENTVFQEIEFTPSTMHSSPHVTYVVTQVQLTSNNPALTKWKPAPQRTCGRMESCTRCRAWQTRRWESPRRTGSAGRRTGAGRAEEPVPATRWHGRRGLRVAGPVPSSGHARPPPRPQPRQTRAARGDGHARDCPARWSPALPDPWEALRGKKQL